MEIDDFLDVDASRGELAACGLVMELLHTAGTLTVIAQMRVLEAEDGEDQEEQALIEVTRRYMDLALPALVSEGEGPCLEAAGLIALIRERILADLERETAERARLN
ncbi:MAG: hypothetical protein M9938_03820 [Solirubrobacterales bacterium]|nr:hypothetical protein [Solirubrobacterales bacterium]